MAGFDALLPRAQPEPQRFLWAVVTATSPLRVQLDGDPGPLPITPDTLVAGLAIGDRVWCQLTTPTDPRRSSRRLVVVGRAGGLILPPDLSDDVSTLTSDVATLNSAVTSLDTRLDTVEAAWTNYASFAITATTTNPTKGADTVYVARYHAVGKAVDYMFSVTIGSGWSSGSGAYIFPLPVAARAVGQQVGPVVVLDAGAAYRVGFVQSASDTSHCRIILDSAGDYLGSAGPGTAWASGDSITAQMRYETA